MVYSGNPTLHLHGQRLWNGAVLRRNASLILDAPWGYALAMLENLPRPMLVVTGNPSRHYLQDLVELKPEGLIANPVGPSEVMEALKRISEGKKILDLPEFTECPLPDSERAVLRLLAFGVDNQGIAERLEVSLHTVENRVASLKEKLGVENRVEMALCYLGLHPKQWAEGKLPL